MGVYREIGFVRRMPRVSYLEEASFRREGVHAAVVLGTGEEHGELDPRKRNFKNREFRQFV